MTKVNNTLLDDVENFPAIYAMRTDTLHAGEIGEAVNSITMQVIRPYKRAGITQGGLVTFRPTPARYLTCSAHNVAQ